MRFGQGWFDTTKPDRPKGRKIVEAPDHFVKPESRFFQAARRFPEG
jgi:hypothetical protein